MRYEIYNKKVSVTIQILRSYLKDEKSKDLIRSLNSLNWKEAQVKEFLKSLKASYKCSVTLSIRRSKKNLEDIIIPLCERINEVFNNMVARSVEFAALNFKNSDVDRYSIYKENFIIFNNTPEKSS